MVHINGGGGGGGGKGDENYDPVRTKVTVVDRF
jgi:hypothetical protein